MVKTRQKVSATDSVSPSSEMSPDSTTSRRQHLRKSHDGKAVKGFFRHSAASHMATSQNASDNDVEPSTSQWTATNAHHVSSVAAEAAKLVAPFVSITPTSPEHSKSFASLHSRGFQNDTLEVRPVAAPSTYIEPTSTTSERRKRRSNVLVPLEENSVLRRCLRRRERHMWSKIGDMPVEENVTDDDIDDMGPSSAKKRAFMKPLYSKTSSNPGASNVERRKKRSTKSKRRMRRHEREMLSSDEEDLVNIVDSDDSSSDEDDANRPPGDRVAYIHVGEGGEADLEAQLKGAENLDIQILEEESLPDIDETDMIHGLDHTGTARDYVDERHRCTVNCPVGCQGHLRPNEIVIYESYKWRGKLLGRRR